MASRCDVICFDPDGTKIAYAAPDGRFGPVTNPTCDFHTTCRQGRPWERFVVDLDGNRRADLVGRAADGIHVNPTRSGCDQTLFHDGCSIYYRNLFGTIEANLDIEFTLDAGPRAAGKRYVLMASTTGVDPGTMLFGGAMLPLTYDRFTEWSLLGANSATFVNSAGVLDPRGRATARYATTPIGVTLARATYLSYWFAYAWYDDVANRWIPSNWVQFSPIP